VAVHAVEVVGERGAGAARRLWRAAAEAAVRVVHGESVPLRAMALTYLSLFALVPALVVAFSVVQAFTGMERIAGLVHEFLLDNLAVGAKATLEPYLERFVGNAHAASAGLVGGALLVWSMVSLFANVDRAINDVWGIRHSRSLRQQAVTYWAGLTLGPLLLAGSLVLGHTARAWLSGSGLAFLAAGSSVLLTCAFFATLYVIVPATPVRVGAAVAGGLVAGLAWELAKWGYAAAVTRFFRYHVIYGSVAAVPTFLLWLFLSWAILLYGARVAFILQDASTLFRGSMADHPTTRELLAGRLLVEVGLAFDRPAGAPAAEAPDDETLARALCVPVEEVRQVADRLSGAGVLQTLDGGGLVPARPLERITLREVRQALLGEPRSRPGDRPGAIDRSLAEVEAEVARRLEGTTLRALCDEERAIRARPADVAVGGSGAAQAEAAG
jgi:membrane protein